MKRNQLGFTLVEIAIVLIIIGLLLGGILKGREMIVSGQVRNMIAQGDAVTVAVFAFQDRYKALPGDFSRATTSVKNCVAPCANGNGNGRIETIAEAGDVWQHLALAGFLTGIFNGNDTATVAANWVCSPLTCPANVFGGTLMLVNDDEALGATVSDNALELYSGQNVPIGVMLAIDTKIDDGLPGSGRFQLSDTHNAACDSGGTGLYTITAAPNAVCGGVYRNF